MLNCIKPLNKVHIFNVPNRRVSAFSFDVFRRRSNEIRDEFFQQRESANKYNIFLQFTAPHLKKPNVSDELNRYKRLDINLVISSFIALVYLTYVSCYDCFYCNIYIVIF